MPIRPALRWYYPIDWPQLSHWVRFGRARGHCQHCTRPHGHTVNCLPNGDWQHPHTAAWFDGKGRPIVQPLQTDTRSTRVVLAAAHLDHDPSNNKASNLKALCQRCHMLHDRPHHLRQRWLNHRRRWAVGDLFLGAYS